MAALEQATNPQRPPEDRKNVRPQKSFSIPFPANQIDPEQLPMPQGEDRRCNTAPANTPVPINADPPVAALATESSTISHPDSGDLVTHLSHAEQVDSQLAWPHALPRVSAGEPPFWPQSTTTDPVDQLFSDSELSSADLGNITHGSDDDKHVHENAHNGTTRSSDVEAISSCMMDDRPYDPNSPQQFYRDLHSPDLKSPQISPGTFDHPYHQSSPSGSQPDIQASEIQSGLSEDDQISHFGDKAFRKALQEVEPSLSKQQRYYAWKNAYQDAFLDQPNNPADLEDFEAEPAAPNQPDKNPPYQLGMAPVGYMDGVPIFADDGSDTAADRTHPNIDQISYADQATAAEPNPEAEKRQSYDETQIHDGLKHFPRHHAVPAPTAPMSDLAERERMLDSSFSRALQALERNNTERIEREREVDEARLQRLRSLSRRHEWKVDDGLEDKNLACEEQPSHTERVAVPVSSMDAFPKSQTVWVQNTECEYVKSSRVVPDGSFALAPEFTDDERGDGEGKANISDVAASRVDSEWHRGAQEHDSDEDEDFSPPGSQIPGLDHLNPPSRSWRKNEECAQLSSTPISIVPPSPGRHLRKSIEPETPTHLLNRDPTPAFEDRSPTPSPCSLRNPDVDGYRNDVEMDEASSVTPQGGHLKEQPTDSPNLHSEISNQTSIPAPASVPNQGRSQSRPPSEPCISPSSTTHTVKSSKARTPSRNRKNRRRSSIVTTPGVKIEKPHKPTPKSRSTSRKLTFGAASLNSNDQNNKSEEGLTKSRKRVQQAVERIEASVRNQDRGQGRRGPGGTPPTRRSRRLMEKEGKVAAEERQE